MTLPTAHTLADAHLPYLRLLPPGVVGIDAGLTMTKVARGTTGGLVLTACETGRVNPATEFRGQEATGITGAGAARFSSIADSVTSQEIEAAARGVRALLATDGSSEDTAFLLALLGTGTAFAVVRAESVQHLGGTALGGGSFAGIARRVDPALSYDAMIMGAHRGDRRKTDIMVGDAYPGGIGRIGGDLTAAHLAGSSEQSIDDVLAGLLNLHGESIAQIAASRARMAGVGRIVLAGGFAHNNQALVASITQMCEMFGVPVQLPAHAGYAGAIGAGLAAADVTGQKESAL